VEDALGHLRGFFGGVVAVEITSDRIGSYISWRQEQRAASATIKRELAALGRAFRLAQKAGMVAFRPEISTLREERQPREFFEADQYRAVLENLPEYLKPEIQTAFITGWRIKSEILTRQKQHLDLQSGFLNLEREETSSGEERRFPLTPGMGELLVRQLKEVNELERKTNRTFPGYSIITGSDKGLSESLGISLPACRYIRKGAPRFPPDRSSQSRKGGHPALGRYGDGRPPHGIDLSALQGRRRSDAQGECSKARGAP